MTKNFSLLLLFISILSFAQIKFKPGYFITNDGTKKECFIKDMAWKEFPEYFSYKETENGEIEKAGITNVKEFSVDHSKYVRFDFNVDDSPTNLNAMGPSRKPIWIKKTAFLKLLADGETQLYKYSYRGNKKYFVKKPNSNVVEQLIYKQYLVEGTTQSYVQSNNDYKKQLDSINPNFDTSKIKYDDSSLISLFTKNSEKQNQDNNRIAEEKFNIRAKIGFLNGPSKSSSVYSVSNFESKTVISPSVEAEYVFAFNKNKWSVFAELTYRGISTEKNVQSTFSFTFTTNRLYEVKNNSILIPTGIKHYIFLNDDNKIFFGAAVMSTLVLNSKVKESDPTTGTVYYDYDDSSFSILAGYQFGLGYVYKNKFSVEGKFLSDNSLVMSKGHFYGLSVGYNIF
ncbi:hypothetical protein PQ459_08705 [Chryseobacterium sp. KACC 21268]|nr:hypothetical protein PQ459_08705 [Chryseobacterium sp. KACC 21268]